MIDYLLDEHLNLLCMTIDTEDKVVSKGRILIIFDIGLEKGWDHIHIANFF